MKYTFGVSDTAAQRLSYVADFFNPHSAEFIRAHAPESVASCLDLGCGPGFTTEMVARSCGAARVWGLDSSEDFLARARARFPGFEFIHHDVTVPPLPVRPDLIFARFLLTHLPDPVGLANQWIGSLAPGGILLFEEPEAIHTEVPVFSRYLEMIEGLLESQGTRLYTGAELAAGSYNGEVRGNELAVLPAPDRCAARWFHMNTRTVFNEDFIKTNYPPEELIRVESGLREIMERQDDGSSITWHLRRIAVRKKEGST